MEAEHGARAGGCGRTTKGSAPPSKKGARERAPIGYSALWNFKNIISSTEETY